MHQVRFDCIPTMKPLIERIHPDTHILRLSCKLSPFTSRPSIFSATAQATLEVQHLPMCLAKSGLASR